MQGIVTRNGGSYSVNSSNTSIDISYISGSNAAVTEAMIKRQPLRAGNMQMYEVILNYDDPTDTRLYDSSRGQWENMANRRHKVYIDGIDIGRLTSEPEYGRMLMENLLKESRIIEKEDRAAKTPGYAPGFVYVGHVGNDDQGQLCKIERQDGQTILNQTTEAKQARRTMLKNELTAIKGKEDAENQRHNNIIARLAEEKQRILTELAGPARRTIEYGLDQQS